MTNGWKIAFLVSLIGCAHGISQPDVSDQTPTARYNVTIFDNFDGAEVHACFEGFVPSHLAALDDDAEDSIRRAWSKSAPLDIRAGRIALPPTHDACVSYETRFANEMFRTDDTRAVLVSQAEWLWRPEPFPPDLVASVSIAMPTGARASLPWVRDGATYHPDSDVFFQSGYNVFGVFSEERFSVDGTAVTLARLGTLPTNADVQRWLTRAIRAAASVGDKLPAERLHFVVVPVETPGRPVAFGMVRRGGGVSVLLIASTTAQIDELEADWIAVHELSHLWLPRVYSQDRWLTEGIATYLQEVLRARCGLQSAEISWNRIRDGLERGRRAGTGRALTSESRDMGFTGAYFRVYWAGTAFAMEADVRLRSESAGQMTLLRALDLAQPHLSKFEGPVNAEKVLTVLDDVSGTNFLVELGARYASATRFPAATFLDDPAGKRIRGEIMELELERCGPRVVSPSVD